MIRPFPTTPTGGGTAPADGAARGGGWSAATADVTAAVEAARLAQPGWGGRPVTERLRPIRGLRGELGRHGAELAALSGRADRPAREARIEALSAEVIPLADACAFLARRAAEVLAPRRPGSDGRPGWLAGVDLEVRREPRGVVLVVAPSNYPIFLPGVQAVQALVAGNAVLLKPGLGGGPAARWLADRLDAAGLPPGVLGVLPEDPAAVRRAVAAGVDHVVLTGSAETGREVLAELAPRLVPATLELSGCDPLIALDDADPALVADALAFGLRLNGGATCIAPRRAFVHRSLLPEVERRLVRAVGEGTASGTRPSAPSDADLRRARELASRAVTAGASLVFGNLGPGAPAGPLVVSDPPRDAALLNADVFAPLVILVPVDGAAEAVALANAGPYALGASVFGDERRARALAGRLRAGVVTVNDAIVPTADPRLPFGGRGRSGYGVTRGAEGLLEMTVPKAVSVRRASRRLSGRRHLERPLPEDEALFRAWLGVAHGATLGRRLRAVPALLRALLGRVRAERRRSPDPRLDDPGAEPSPAPRPIPDSTHREERS